MPGSSTLSQRTPSSRPSGDIVASSGWQEFGNQHLDDLLAQNGIGSAASDAVCGPIAIAALAKTYGVDTDPGQVAALGLQRKQWAPGIGMTNGSGGGVRDLLGQLGIDTTNLSPSKLDTAIGTIQAGTPVILNFPNHYMFATQYNPDTGQFFVGATGSNALRGGGDWMTLDQMNGIAGNGGALRSIIVPTEASPNPPDTSAATGGNPPSGRQDTGGNPNPPDTSAPTDIESYIRERAAHYGIDPDTAVQVANSEGGLQSWNRQSDYINPNTGQREQSFGPFQLYVNGGLGNAFQQQTGLDPSDPAAGPAAVDFALSQAAKGGWGPWHGAARVGIGNWQGIGGTPSATTDQSALAPNTNEYHGQMQDANGQPMSSSSDPFGGTDSSSQYDPTLPEPPRPDPFGGTDRTSQYDPSLPLDQQGASQSAGVPPNPMNADASYQPPASNSPMDQMPPGMRQPDWFLNAGQTASQIPGRLVTGQNVWTGGEQPIISQQEAEQQVIDPHHRMTPWERERAAQQYMDDVRGVVMGPTEDLKAVGEGLKGLQGAGQAARAAEAPWITARRLIDDFGLDPNSLRASLRRGDTTAASMSEAAGIPLPQAEAVTDYLRRTEVAHDLPPNVGAQYDPLRNIIRVPPGEAISPATWAHEAAHQDFWTRLTPEAQTAWRDTVNSNPKLRDLLVQRYLSGTGHAENVDAAEEIYAHLVESPAVVDGLPPAWQQAFQRMSGGQASRAASSLPDALSGKAGGMAGLAPAVHLGSAAAGAGLGYEADPNASPGERLRNAAIGGVAGYVGARLLTRPFERPPVPRPTGVPEIDAINSQWAAQRPQSAITRLLSGVGDLPKNVETRLLDEYARINAATTTARKALGVRNPLLTPENIDAEGKFALFADRVGAGSQWLQDGLGPIGDLLRTPEDYANFNTMVKLQRDIEVGNLRIARGANPADLKFSGGVQSIADAQNRLALLESHVGPQTWQTYRQADGLLKAHLNSILDRKVQAGLLDPQWAAWLKQNHPNYSPQMLADLDSATHTLVGKNFRINSNGIRRLSELGHTGQDLPPLQAAAVLTLRENNRAMRNEAVNALVDALKLDPKLAGQIVDKPATKLVTGMDVANQVPGTTVATRMSPMDLVNVPGAVPRLVNGKFVVTTVPPWAEQLVKGLTAAPEEAALYERIARTLNSTARMAITQRNPIFPVLNGQADALVALAQGLRPDEIARAYPAVITQSQEWKDFIRLGGGRGGWHLSPEDLAQIETHIRETGGVTVRTPNDVMNLIGKAITLKPVEAYGNVVEMAPRIAAYRKALAAGASPTRAALEGRRITLDFNRAGTWVRKANAYTLFLNAGVQGTAQLVRIARDHPKSVAAFTAGINAAVLGAYAWNRQFVRPTDGKPYLDDIPEYIQQTNLILTVPGSQYTDAQGQPRIHYLAIPLRQMAVLATPAMMALRQMEQKDPQGFAAEMARFGLRTLSPVQAETPLGAMGQVLPAGASTAIELGTNTDFYRNLPIEPQGMRDLPAERRVRPADSPSATPPWAIAATGAKIPLVGKSLNDFGLSPIQAQYTAQDLGAGVGQIGTAAGTAAVSAASGKPTDAALQQLWQATGGRIYRDRAGGIEQAKGTAFDQQLSDTQQRAYDALKQQPGWNRLSVDEQNRQIRQIQNKAQAGLVKQLGAEAPSYLQPGPPADGHPPKFELRSLSPALRNEYRDNLYQLEQDVNAARAKVSAYTNGHSRIRPTRRDELLAQAAAYPSRAWQIWSQKNRPAAARRADEAQRIVDEALAGAGAP